MKRILLAVIAFFLALPAWTAFPGEAKESGKARDFDRDFENATLRLDYVFCGDSGHQAIYFQQALRTSAWAGRRHNLSEPLLEGNGQIRVLDPETGVCLYANSFSTLFQEWQVTEEARHVEKAFENCFQVPFPKRPVDIEVFLVDTHRKRSSYLRHRIDPADILIRKMAGNDCSSAVVWQGGPLDETIDIVVVSEGYDASEKAKFYGDAERVAQALFHHEPFAGLRNRFSVRAVFAPSADSGVSVPREGSWKRTVADSHFDTFYTDRYLTSSAQQKIYDLIGTVPFEHIVVLVNTPIYGGGGIYNSLTIMNSDHPTFVPVMVHEFGHAFGGLADEYAYGDQAETSYPADTEPWEPNITTLHDFASKWQDMLPQGIQIPTPVDDLDKQDVRRIWNTFTPEQKGVLNLKVGVYEGAGYQLHGVYRPVQECRMRINECEEFCPVCYRALVRMIDYYTDGNDVIALSGNRIPKVQIVAHRGFWEGNAENSVASFRKAQEFGAWGSEFDIHLTADGVPVIHHDRNIGQLDIQKSSFEEVRANRLANGEPVPTLSEYMAQAAQSLECLPVLELKPQYSGEREDELVDRCLQALRPGAPRVVFISFSHHICQELARKAPGHTVQYLNGDLSPAQLHAEGIHGIDYHYSVFYKHPEWVKEAHDLGMSVNVWTVDEPKDIRAMRDLGVDQITTNRPALVREILQER